MPRDPGLPIFVITHRTRDHGERFVVRAHHVGPEGHVIEVVPLAVEDTLEEDARAALAREHTGLVCIGRDPTDDPVIVESWV